MTAAFAPGICWSGPGASWSGAMANVRCWRGNDRFAGLEADSLLSAFATFLMLLGRGSRRVLSVGPPHCAGLTADEERMLRLIAAAQAGEREVASAHLTGLVRRECQGEVM